MPRLKPDQQRARKEHILDAAERCFAEKGFHASTMQDICRAAEVSPGAVYVYFDSKEALISGIAERNRAEFAQRLEGLSEASDLLKALQLLGEQYFVEEPAHKRLMCVEIGIESTRNPRVGEIYRNVDCFVHDSFRAFFQRMRDEGRIAPAIEIDMLVQVFAVIGDGMFWRRAVDPSFDAKAVLPAITSLIGTMLRPVDPAAAGPHPETRPSEKVES